MQLSVSRLQVLNFTYQACQLRLPLLLCNLMLFLLLALPLTKASLSAVSVPQGLPKKLHLCSVGLQCCPSCLQLERAWCAGGTCTVAAIFWRCLQAVLASRACRPYPVRRRRSSGWRTLLLRTSRRRRTSQLAAQPQVFSMQRYQLFLRLHARSLFMSQSESQLHARLAVASKFTGGCTCSAALRFISALILFLLFLRGLPLHDSTVSLGPLQEVLWH